MCTYIKALPKERAAFFPVVTAGLALILSPACPLFTLLGKSFRVEQDKYILHHQAGCFLMFLAETKLNYLTFKTAKRNFRLFSKSPFLPSEELTPAGDPLMSAT